MRVSIMQPYFIPYAGYFRLMSCVDVFVIYDDVQFSKQSWISRNRLTTNTGEREWLSIPLKDKPLETKIQDIEFAEDIYDRWPKILKKFPEYAGNPLADELKWLPRYKIPCSFIVSTLIATARLLGIKPMIIHSSSQSIAKNLKGKDRVIAICKEFKAKQYINAPGGTSLYDGNEFAGHGIDLKFLIDYPNKTSILERLHSERAPDIRVEIDNHTRFQ